MKKRNLFYKLFLEVVNHPWVEGGLVGFSIALFVFFVIQFNLPEQYGFLNFTNYLVSVPAYISVSIDAVDLTMVMIHFGYWTLAVSLLGWCVGKGWTGKGLALCFLIVLVYCHYQANQLMAKRFESAIQQAPESLHW